MKKKKLFVLLTTLLMVFLLLSGATAQENENDFEYESDNPQRSPAFMLRSDPDAGPDWAYTFLRATAPQRNQFYYTMDMLRESNPDGDYEGEGCYTWMRIDATGSSAAADTVIFSCAGENAPIKRLSVAFCTDDEWNVKILSVSTDDGKLL